MRIIYCILVFEHYYFTHKISGIIHLFRYSGCLLKLLKRWITLFFVLIMAFKLFSILWRYFHSSTGLFFLFLFCAVYKDKQIWVFHFHIIFKRLMQEWVMLSIVFFLWYILLIKLLFNKCIKWIHSLLTLSVFWTFSISVLNPLSMSFLRVEYSSCFHFMYN